MRQRSIKGCDGCCLWCIWISGNILCETRDGGTKAYTNSIKWHHSRRYQMELAPRFVYQDNPTLLKGWFIIWKTKSKPASRITKYHDDTVYPKKYAHGFVVLCFVVVVQSFIMNSHEVFIHIHQGCFAGIGAIIRLQQCQWSKPDGYGKISQCITTKKHSKAKTVCIFLGIYCIYIRQHTNFTINQVMLTDVCLDLCSHSVGLHVPGWIVGWGLL